MVDVDKKFEELEAAREAARKVQDEIDRVALLDLIEQHDGDVHAVKLNKYRKGLPTMVIVRAPSRSEIKRFQDRIAKDRAKSTEATIQIGTCCVIYPDKPTFEKMLERVPALDVSCGDAALDLALGRAKSEGKG